ncbi:MAG: hypothetical protein JW860_05695 [Sedimentisphaerales bacterium]|nr:hypothetical protein [Sedimentisphaerales bacterium]
MRNLYLIPVVLACACLLPTITFGVVNVTYTINTETGQAPISPYIYGTNWGSIDDATIKRSGGNRLTGYNWENNFSNAGADWYHHSDRYLVQNLPYAQQTIPGIMLNSFHDAALLLGQASIVTLQMAGYVSADDYGTVDYAERAPSARWKEVVYAKGAPFCSPYDNPDTSDNYVYMDECVNFLVNEYGYANEPDGVKFYCLDNEPALWSDGADGATHPRLHPAKPTCVELRDKSIALSTAVKDVDPYAQILGPVLYGFSAYKSFQGATDWSSEGSGYDWFISYYLDKMEAASVTAGKRLLDILDVHWYPEAYDGPPFTYNESTTTRITNSSVHTSAMYEARMQAPRTLWDTEYVGYNGENSWVNEWNSSYLPILPKLQSSITTYYPGTKLSITEYAYGGEDHWSGGIATTDVLGIYGKYGVYIATYWGDGTYVDAALKIYRNYDGSQSTFGDTKVTASMSDKVNSSVYGSVDSDLDTELHLIVLNKNLTESINGTFNVSSPQTFTSGRVWAFDDASYNISEITPISTITSNSFSYTIPPLTACHIVLEAECPLGDLNDDCTVNNSDLIIFLNQWLDTGGCSGIGCADINDDNTVNLEDFFSISNNWLR